MRYKFAFSVVSVALLLILGPTSSFAQKGKNKGFGGQGGGGFGGPGGGGKGNNGFGGGNPLSNMTALAESEFKFYDTNGDGVLNIDEMPPQLRAELSQWDKDHNNLITLDEYVQYYGNRMLNRNRGGQFNPVNIMI